MSFFCNHCFFLSKQCFVSDKSEKYSECVRSKHSCFFSHSIYIIDVSCLLHAHEKLNHDEKSVLKKCQKFNICFAKLNVKIFCLKCHQCFFKKYDDKLIQESAEIFKEKLHVLKRKQDFIVFLNNNSFNLLVSEINASIVFFILSDNF